MTSIGTPARPCFNICIQVQTTVAVECWLAVYNNNTFHENNSVEHGIHASEKSMIHFHHNQPAMLYPSITFSIYCKPILVFPTELWITQIYIKQLPHSLQQDLNLTAVHTVSSTLTVTAYHTSQQHQTSVDYQRPNEINCHFRQFADNTS